jgi:membrane associated rhomboid family serine protease
MKLRQPNDPWLPRAPVTRWLILLNSAIWLVGLTGDILRLPGLRTQSLLLSFALSPASLFEEGMLWTPFTYMFLHGSGGHLFMNMLGLFLLGPDLERTFGKAPYLTLYLLSGWIGGLGYLGITYGLFGQNSICVGASGAIMGLLGAIVAIYPQREYIILPLMIPARASVLAVLLVSSHVFFMLTPYGGRVAYDVHLFGGLAGYAFAAAAARRHARRVGAAPAGTDPEEFEALVLRLARGGEPLTEQEQQRYDRLRELLRYADVLTLEEIQDRER